MGFQAIGELTLFRNTSSDNITVTGVTFNTLSTGTNYVAEGVGVRNGKPTDTLTAIVFFGVIEEAGEECLVQSCMFCML